MTELSDAKIKKQRELVIKESRASCQADAIVAWYKLPIKIKSQSPPRLAFGETENNGGSDLQPVRYIAMP